MANQVNRKWCDSPWRLLCGNCGVSNRREIPYDCHFRVFRVTGHRGVWTIGPEYFLIEDSKDSPYADGGAATAQSSHQDTTILAAKEIKSWEDAGSKFKLMKGIPDIDSVMRRKQPEAEESCEICGYTSDHAKNPYISHCKLFRLGGGRAVWSIGSEYFLKEEAKGAFGDGGAATVELLRAFTTVPVVSEMIRWEDEESRFTFMKRVPGIPLSNTRLSEEDLRRAFIELSGYLRQIRQFTSPVPVTVNGKPLLDTLVNYNEEDYRFPSTIDEYRDQLKDRLVAKGRLSRPSDFLEGFPKERGRFVLTHADLDPSNIMWDNDHISAILDWEQAGYYPVWWEWLGFHPVGQWEEIFLPVLGDYRDVVTFFDHWGSLLTRRW